MLILVGLIGLILWVKNKIMELDLNKIKNVHYIGIGGIGVSAVARMMVFAGLNVTGQDMQEGEIVDELKKLGVSITIGQSYENIPEDTELVVYTVAIETYDKDLFDKIKYSEVGLPNIKKFIAKSYPEMLGIISSDKYTIAVCGTHGKTTTTGMIAQILRDANYDPTVIVGSLLKDNNGYRTNFIGGKSDYFVVEACEYRRSFLKINPNVLVITNIDEDHLDYYKDIEDIKSAFREMAMKVPADGFIVCSPEDKNIADVINGVKAKIINWHEFYNEKLKLKIPGIHNKKDSAAAIAAAVSVGISKKNGEENVCNFPGTWRRFEFKGKLPNGVLIYDDYAHHPTEIKASIEALREIYPTSQKKITIVFQPHLYSRTKALFDDFAKCFKGVDRIILLPIYFARENIDESISSGKLAEAICQNGDKAMAFTDFELAENFLKGQVFGKEDILVTMGAGEAYKIADQVFHLV